MTAAANGHRLRGPGRNGPLAGVRVVELAGIGPGPFAAMPLADLGADVVRVDRPGGAGLGIDPPHDLTNRNKRSVVLDLKAVGTGPAALDLVERADVLIEGYRPGVTERLGVGPEDCLARNPRLVYGRMTGWGQDGPLAQRAGPRHRLHRHHRRPRHDRRARTGRPSPPRISSATTRAAPCTSSSACSPRSTTPAPRRPGQVVDAAIVDGAAHLTAMIHGMIAAGGWQDRRGANLLDGGCPFYGTYATSDGGYMAVGALERGSTTSSSAARRRGGDPAREDVAALGGAAGGRRRAVQDADPAGVDGGVRGSDACVAPVLSLREAPPTRIWPPAAPSPSTAESPSPRPRRASPRTPTSVRTGARAAGRRHRGRRPGDWDVPGPPTAQPTAPADLASHRPRPLARKAPP